MDVISKPKEKPLQGSIEIPSDKSISHRAAMFSSLTRGKMKISNFSKGADCHSTLGIIKNLGCKVDFINEKTLIVDSSDALVAPNCDLDCGNSGTTMRLMSGLLSGQSFETTLFGDASLSKRPMKRVIEPLKLMGANILHNEYKAPLTIKPAKLSAINYVSPIASAQVKSCLLLAGLNAEGITSIEEPHKSRNHSELMLKYLGAGIEERGNAVFIQKSQLMPKDITVCGDISSAAFFIVAALIVPGSEITLKNVGINDTRSGIIDVVKAMNGDIEILNEREISNEKVADLIIRYSSLTSTTIEGEIIPRLIDEIPVIAVLATQADGATIIKDAQDLRNKEADRIKAMVCELKKIGANVKETEDGLIINGKSSLVGGADIECYHDHRIAMSMYVAGLICEKPLKIKEFQWVNISFPEFENLINSL